MQSAGREPSMEDILASIKKVIAEEKELRTAAPAETDENTPLPEEGADTGDEDVLELDEHLPGIVEDHVKREISRITGKPL